MAGSATVGAVRATAVARGLGEGGGSDVDGGGGGLAEGGGGLGEGGGGDGDGGGERDGLTRVSGMGWLGWVGWMD